MTTPSYLQQEAALYAKDPRQANMKWFKEAKYGLFLHYGLYSLIENKEKAKIQEWVQLNEQIPVAAYAKWAEQFTAEHFDAEAIAAFAVECGMKYINITTR